MEFIKDIILDTGADCLKMLPFLFAAFLLIEALEHYSGHLAETALRKVGKAGPAVAAVAGCVPQCGFSVMAANLYAGGIVSAGTLLAVFIATSDEAVLILLSNPAHAGKVAGLLGVKVVLAVTAGYLVDLFFKNRIETPKMSGELCEECGCHEESAGVLLPAWRHTWRIFVYLLIFTGILNFCIEVLGMDAISAFLLGNTPLQPVVAAVLGFVPNCGASVILTQLYLNGAISFASVIAGLSTSTGIGLVVLFKVNRHRRENVKITGTLFVIAAAAGILLEVIL